MQSVEGVKVITPPQRGTGDNNETLAVVELSGSATVAGVAAAVAWTSDTPAVTAQHPPQRRLRIRCRGQVDEGHLLVAPENSPSLVVAGAWTPGRSCHGSHCPCRCRSARTRSPPRAARTRT